MQIKLAYRAWLFKRLYTKEPAGIEIVNWLEDFLAVYDSYNLQDPDLATLEKITLFSGYRRFEGLVDAIQKMEREIANTGKVSESVILVSPQERLLSEWVNVSTDGVPSYNEQLNSFLSAVRLLIRTHRLAVANNNKADMSAFNGALFRALSPIVTEAIEILHVTLSAGGISEKIIRFNAWEQRQDSRS